MTSPERVKPLPMDLTMPPKHLGSAAELADKTITGLLAARLHERPETPAFFQLQGTDWVPTSWRDHAARVLHLGAALRRIGVARGDRVAVMGDTSPDWLLADVANISVGGITVGIYFTSSPEEIDYFLKDSGAVAMFVGSAAELKLAARAEEARQLKQIIVLDSQWQADADTPANAIALAAFLEGASRPPLTALAQLAAEARPEEVVSIGYTSGTTGEPKGVINTHYNLLGGGASIPFLAPEIQRRQSRVAVHLPMSHIVARVQATCLPLILDSTPYFGAGAASFEETVRRARPNFYMAPPRFYQRFAAAILGHVNAAPPAERAAYRLAMTIARKALKGRQSAAGKADPLIEALYATCREEVFAPLLARVGFDDLVAPRTASAPMPAEVMTLWQLWGLNLKEVYGQTETVGANIAQLEDWPAAGTIGRPIPDPAWETRISEDGEMLVRGPGVTRGYWGKPEESAEALAGGWLHTGDIVAQDRAGNYRLIDRRKEIIKTSNGKTISPTQIENELRGSPNISEAVVIGEGRKYLTALIEVDPDIGLGWAKANDAEVQGYEDLCRSETTRLMISAEIERANRRLARAEQIKAFRILPEELSVQNGVVTPTRKKRRKQIYQRYHQLIETMYDRAEEDLIDIAIGRRPRRD